LAPNTNENIPDPWGFPGCTVQERAGAWEGPAVGDLVREPRGWLPCQLPGKAEFEDTRTVAVSSRSDKTSVTGSSTMAGASRSQLLPPGCQHRLLVSNEPSEHWPLLVLVGTLGHAWVNSSGDKPVTNNRQ